jgi:hypothetical protein
VCRFIGLGRENNMDDKQKAGQYLKDLNEWQDKMYSPGAYLGGNLPPVLKYGNRKIIKPWAVVSLVILGLMVGLAIVNMIMYFINGKGLSFLNL